MTAYKKYHTSRPNKLVLNFGAKLGVVEQIWSESFPRIQYFCWKNTYVSSLNGELDQAERVYIRKIVSNYLNYDSFYLTKMFFMVKINVENGYWILMLNE